MLEIFVILLRMKLGALNDLLTLLSEYSIQDQFKFFDI